MSSTGHPARFGNGKLLHLAFLAWTCAACKGESFPMGPDEEVPIYGRCDVQPSYVTEVDLNRWRSFPLTYFFDSASFPAEFLEDYRIAINDGLGRWDDATVNELGAVVEVADRSVADFVITYREFTPLTAPSRTVHSTGTPFLAGGEIMYNSAAMAEPEELIREGRLSHEGFRRGLSGIAAHELGHLMGIIGHSSRTDVLMGPTFHDAPTEWDVNTLIRAYCHT